MTDHVQLTAEFRPENYDYIVTVAVDELWNKKGEQIIPANTEPGSAASPANEKMAAIASILKKGGITDYHLKKNLDCVTVYLRTELDAYLLNAGIMMKSPYKCDFISAPEDTSVQVLWERMYELQDIFMQTPLIDRVFFFPEEDRKVISAMTNNGSDMVELHGLAKEIELEKLLNDEPAPEEATTKPRSSNFNALSAPASYEREYHPIDSMRRLPIEARARVAYSHLAVNARKAVNDIGPTPDLL